MATLTPQAQAVANGTYGLEDIIFALAFEGELDESGVADNEMGKLSISMSGGNAVAFSLSLGDQPALQLAGVSINYDALQAAVSVADGGEGSFSDLYALFSDIDYIADFSSLTQAVGYTFGLGGDDQFKLTSFADTFFLDGGTDWIKMGGGDDTIGISSLGFISAGTSKVEGAAGLDTLELSQETPMAMTIDLTKTSTIKTSDGNFKVELKQVENINGSSAAEKLFGSDVVNTLSGAAGNDVLAGRGGADTLRGGLDADDFVYLDVKDSGAKAKADTILDFEVGIDDIDLSAIDPKTKNDKFSFIGDDDFSKKAGQLRFEQHDKFGEDDDYTLVQADLNGDKKVDLEIRLTGLVDLHKGDFIL